MCIAIAGNLSGDIYKIFEKSNLSGINKNSTYGDSNLINHKINTSLKIRNGRELIKIDNLNFQNINGLVYPKPQ